MAATKFLEELETQEESVNSKVPIQPNFDNFNSSLRKHGENEH